MTKRYNHYRWLLYMYIDDLFMLCFDVTDWIGLRFMGGIARWSTNKRLAIIKAEDIDNG